MLAEKRDSGSHICFSKGFTLGLLMMAKPTAIVIPRAMASPWAALLGWAAGVQSELPVTANVFSESFSRNPSAHVRDFRGKK